MDIECAHLVVSAKRGLYMFSSVTLIFSIISIYISAHPHHIINDPDPNTTNHIRTHYQYYENGNGSIYVDNEYNHVKDIFQPFYIEKMSIYTFGTGNISFCNERNVSVTNQWSTSLFRSTQLYSSVQTPIKYGVLLLVHPLLILAFVTAKIYMFENSTYYSIFVGFSYFFNELILQISYFLLSALHVYMDKKYIPYSTTYFTLAVFTTITKMLLRNMMEGFKISSIFRFFSILIITFCYPILKFDIEDYAEHIYCDNFAPPIVTILQFVCISIITLNTFHDIRKTSNLLLVISPSIDELHCRTHPSILVRKYF